MVPTIKDLRKQVGRKNHTYLFGKRIGPKDSTYYYPLLSYVFIVKYLRFFSIFFTKVFLYMNVTANQVTLLTIFLGILSAILLGFNIYSYSIISLIILQLVHILDCTDGEVSRYRKTTSHSGDYLDIVQHWLTESLVFILLGYGLFKQYNYPEILVLGAFISISFLIRELYLMSSTFICVEFKVVGFKDELTPKKIRQKNKEPNPLLKYMQNVNSFFDFFLGFHGVSSVLLVFAILNLLIIPFIFYGIIIPLTVIFGLYYEFHKGPERGYLKLQKIKDKI